MLYLLDTNICIYGRIRRPEILARFALLTIGEAGMSVVTYGELAYGCTKSSDPQLALARLSRFLDFIPAVPLPLSAGTIYGRIRRDLELRGERIGPNDLWVASHAMASDLILVTNNEREFRRIPGLKIENWAK